MFHAWLWPDKIIGKRESRRLRSEYNELHNAYVKLSEAYIALKMLRNALPIHTDNGVILAAMHAADLAIAEVESTTR